jgi:hypothetical protein
MALSTVDYLLAVRPAPATEDLDYDVLAVIHALDKHSTEKGNSFKESLNFDGVRCKS